MDIFFYEKIFSPIAMHVTTVASSCFNSIISWSSEIVAQNNILFSLSDMTLSVLQEIQWFTALVFTYAI